MKEHGFEGIAGVCELEKLFLELLTAKLTPHETALGPSHPCFVEQHRGKDQERLRILLQEELMAGEAISWTGRTARLALVKRKLSDNPAKWLTIKVLRLVPVMLAMTFMLSIVSGEFTKTFETFIRIFAFLIISIIVMFTSVWAIDIVRTLLWFDGPHYAITNKRVIIIEGKCRVRSFFPRHINDVKRIDVTPEFCDIIFFKDCLLAQNGQEVSKTYEFYHIPDGERAEQSLRALSDS